MMRNDLIRIEMPNDFGKFEKLVYSSALKDLKDDDSILIIVRIHENSTVPNYIKVRYDFGPYIFTTEIKVSDLGKLNNEPTVKSITVSRRLSRV